MSQADSLIGRTITSADGKISGVVSEVRLYKDGVAAILPDGRQIAVLPGVTIKATPA
jgi:flagellar basal-body rod modification protein FlgD